MNLCNTVHQVYFNLKNLKFLASADSGGALWEERQGTVAAFDESQEIRFRYDNFEKCIGHTAGNVK